MSDNTLRSAIKAEIINYLSENTSTDGELTEQRKAQINSHVDKLLSDFSDKVRKLAIENNHPYVRAYLDNALYKLETSIEKKECIMLGADELFL